MVVLIVWLSGRVKITRYKVLADLYAKAIEKGQTVPDDWFMSLTMKRNPLNTGIIWLTMGVGIALWVFLLKCATSSSEAIVAIDKLPYKAASFGIIPFMIGVAYIIIHFIEKKKTAVSHAK
jgi:hypothetical protein